MSLLLFGEPVHAKNDTVFISNIDKVIRFDACFSNVFYFQAIQDIQAIMESDPDNYDLIVSNIKHMLVNKKECDPNAIIPTLKSVGSLRHITNYKKMYHIYFKKIKGLRTWANQVYYITNENGDFLYVEFKDIYPGKNLVFDQSLLKSVRINKKMLIDLGLKM
jgi:hypothetical protein